MWGRLAWRHLCIKFSMHFQLIRHQLWSHTQIHSRTAPHWIQIHVGLNRMPIVHSFASLFWFMRCDSIIVAWPVWTAEHIFPHGHYAAINVPSNTRQFCLLFLLFFCSSLLFDFSSGQSSASQKWCELFLSIPHLRAKPVDQQQSINKSIQQNDEKWKRTTAAAVVEKKEEKKR